MLIENLNIVLDNPKLILIIHEIFYTLYIYE